MEYSLILKCGNLIFYDWEADKKRRDDRHGHPFVFSYRHLIEIVQGCFVIVVERTVLT